MLIFFLNVWLYFSNKGQVKYPRDFCEFSSGMYYYNKIIKNNKFTKMPLLSENFIQLNYWKKFQEVIFNISTYKIKCQTQSWIKQNYTIFF